MIAAVCIPWMLIPKPVVLIARLKGKAQKHELEGDGGDFDEMVELRVQRRKAEDKSVSPLLGDV